MAERRRSFLAAVFAIAVIGLATAWVLSALRNVPKQDHAVSPFVVTILKNPVVLPAPGNPATPDPAPPDPSPPMTVPAEAAPQDEPDLASWDSARFAFTFRELGAMGPYVKVGLDGARRDMAFCFDQPGAAAADPAEVSSQPAVLLLYLEAREGAIDVVDVRAERLGGATSPFVECCRQVLRGLEIPAFKAVPGQRYRVRFQLD